MTLEIVANSFLRIDRENLRSEKLSVSELRDLLSYDNPDYYKRQRMGFYTGDVDRKLTLVESDPTEIRLPRGVWTRLREFLERAGTEWEVVNETVSGTLDRNPFEWRAPFELDPDQRSAARACVRGRNGIVVGVCGSGKTEVALKAISEVGERTLILVHTERILKSWLEKATERFPEATIGVYYGKRKQPGADLVIGMIRSVLNLVRDSPKWANSFGCVVGDECHHFAANTFSDLISYFPAKWRLGFTATPKRKDGKEVLFFDAFGAETKRAPKSGKTTSGPKVLFQITDETLEKYGRIVPIDVVVVPTEFHFDLNHEERLIEEGWVREPQESAVASVKRWATETGHPGPLNTYTELLDELVRDRHRQARILEYLLPEISAGNPSLLLADRRELGLEIRSWLRRRKVEVGILMGGRSRKEGDKTVEALEAERLVVAVGTTVADEGMDVGILSRGFGCTPVGNNPSRLIQQFGRFKRKAEGKEDARYFYFWDRKIRGFRGHLRSVFNSVRPPHRIWWSERRGEYEPLTRSLVKQLEG